MVNHVLVPGGTPERSNDAGASLNQLGHALPHGRTAYGPAGERNPPSVPFRNDSGDVHLT